MSRTRPRAAAALAALLLVLGAPAQAQEALRYTQTTALELGGYMGAAVAFSGGLDGVDEPVVQHVLLQGSHMREDRGEVTTLTDFSRQEVTILDHQARTWRTVSMEGRMEELMDEARGPARDRERPEGMDLGMTFRTEATGRTDTVAGFPARQVVFVLDMGGTVGAMGVRTAMVSELWVSDALPVEGLAPEARTALSAGYEPDSMGALLGGLGPELARIAEEQRDALRALEGMTVRAVAHMVMLPPEGELDVEAVLATGPLDAGTEGLSDAEAAARARQRVMELFQGGRDADPVVTMRSRTEISAVEQVPAEPDAFAIPEGYSEAPDPGGRSG